MSRWDSQRSWPFEGDLNQQSGHHLQSSGRLRRQKSFHRDIASGGNGIRGKGDCRSRGLPYIVNCFRPLTAWEQFTISGYRLLRQLPFPLVPLPPPLCLSPRRNVYTASAPPHLPVSVSYFQYIHECWSVWLSILLRSSTFVLVFI